MTRRSTNKLGINDIQNILLMFDYPFLAASENLSPKEKKFFLNNMHAIYFKKWLYSALYEDTIISPVNILDNYFSEKNTVVGVDISYNSRSRQKFTYRVTSDTVNNHSFLNNLKIICDYCNPVASLNSIPEEIKNKLYFMDIFYFEFLIIVALEFNLITQMYGIHTVKYQKNSEKCKKFFSLEPKNQLEKIANFTLAYAENNINKKLGIPHTVNSGFLSLALEKFVSTDDIYRTIFDTLGFDFDNMIELSNKNNLTESEEILMSSAFYLGSLLDKYFLSPMGHYLKLITVLYSMPIDFITEVDFIRPVLLTDCDFSPEVFAPSNYFNLTCIGTEILGLKKHDNSFESLKKDFSFNDLDFLIQTKSISDSIEITENMNNPLKNSIYVFKIYFKNNKNMWKIVQVPNFFTLKQFYDFISNCFGLEYSNNFSFKPFEKSDTISYKSILFKNTKTSLKKIDFENTELILTDEINKSVSLIISMQKNISPIFVGPPLKLLKQSKAITMEERKEL